jgi:hypothetical protein
MRVWSKSASRLVRGNLAFVDQPDAAPGFAFVAFSGQRLSQKRLMRQVLLGCGGRQLPGLGPDGGQLQGFGGGCDGGVGSRLGQR